MFATDILKVHFLKFLLQKRDKLLLVEADSPFHARVPMVFDGVISATFQNIGNISPLVGLISIQKIKNPFFLGGPLSVSLDHGIQMIVPSLPALFTDSAR